MHKPDSNMTKTFAVGALVGAVVGAAFALLYAPKAGRELRTDLRRQGGRLRTGTAQTVARLTPSRWRTAQTRHTEEQGPAEKAA